MIYACEHHDEILTLWREQDLREIRLSHVDFHDDLRGMLVDQRARRAYPIGDFSSERTAVDPGNFLAHAIVEGRLECVRWLHTAMGGRAWDMGIVRYASDLSSWPRRLRHRLRGGPVFAFEFEELLLDDWPGLAGDERLSVDWDCFASILQNEEGVEARLDLFRSRLGTSIPPDTYLAYSPEYCHPSLDRFRSFVHELSAKFGQGICWHSSSLVSGQLTPAAIDTRLPRHWLKRAILFLRRRGIY
jgi:hypothetical protein